MLEIRNITKKYKDTYALKGVTFSLDKEVVGLMGVNGAGKTTLIRVMTGLQRPTDGSYELMGKANNDKDIAKARRRMGAVIEEHAIFKDKVTVHKGVRHTAMGSDAIIRRPTAF